MKKVHIITGASRGIGKQIAITLSHSFEESIFVLLARDREALLETKKKMFHGAEIIVQVIDLTNDALIIETIQSIGNRFGRIDTLVNVAGYVDPKSLLETTVENLKLTYAVNVFSVFIITQEVVRFMKNTGGKILNIASTAGLSSRPGWSVYASSKAAVISLSNTLSDELEGYGIKIYTLSPGRCATDLRKKLAPEEDPDTIMQPKEVAEVVSNLLGVAGDNLDGQNIVIRKQIK